MKLTTWLNSLVSCTFLIISYNVNSQVLTLAQSQQEARANYPAIRQKDLIRQTENLTISNLNKYWLPQISVNAQASYQSDVTSLSIPIPGISINPLNKDQYKLTTDINQSVFDGGVTYRQKQIEKLNSAIENEKMEVELHTLRERINQLFLGILLQDQQLKQVELIKADINTGIKKTEALVKNGLSFRSNLDNLAAELIKTEQRQIELQASRKGLIKTLALFTGRKLDENVRLQYPEIVEQTLVIKRPEIDLFRQQNMLLDDQKKLLAAKNLPRAGLFAQGGYGRPGLNMLENQFDWFYIAGIRLSWNLGTLYTNKKDKDLLSVREKSVSLQQETFMLNTNAQLIQQQADIDKLERLVASDKTIIALREKVKTAANAQLENQVISTSDYLREVNAEDQARQLLILHQLQLLQAKLNYNTIAGI